MSFELLTPTIFFQTAVSGLLLGGVYALIALGLTLIFGVMRVINVAHGTFLMVGAYITYWLFHLYGVNPILSLIISMPLLFVFGLVLHRFVIAKVVDAPELTSLLVTFGISIFIINVVIYFFSSDFRAVPYLTGSVKLQGVAFSMPRSVAFGVALAISILSYLFLKKTRLGKAIRAVSQHRDVAQICGIDIGRIDMVAFGLGLALAAAGGSLISFLFVIFPEMGNNYLLKCFAVVILGGIGSYTGAFLGGLLIGVSEAFGALLISAQAAEAVAYIILVMVLLLKPSGLVGGVWE
ncbi:MAG: branched-chain amino acid ABC transporter permease [bacterium]|nr:branched-chain amino acid ABC transporter permease [bacterium]